LWLPVMAGAAGLALSRFDRRARAQSADIPGEFQNVPMLPGRAGPYSSLAGVDPAAPIPAAWVPRPVVAALPALPPHIQAWEDAVVGYRPARSGFNLHAYGYERKLGMCQHIPVCDDLPTLTAYFVGGKNAGLTTYGVGRVLFKTLDLAAPDGSVCRVPFAEVHRYGPIGTNTWSPWAQGLVNRGGTCAVPPHPVAAYLGSGVPNGAYDSVENVARIGSQGMTGPQLNSNAMLRAASAFRNGYPINDETQVSHAAIDRINRCFDPGWPAGLEDEARAIARAILAGDLSKLHGALRLNAPPPAINWQDEAWRALVNKRLRIQQDAYAVEQRDAADERTNQALTGLDPSGWQGVAIAAWQEQLGRDNDDIAKSTARREAALAQLRRLGI
jgi:hypothetical protein